MLIQMILKIGRRTFEKREGQEFGKLENFVDMALKALKG